MLLGDPLDAVVIQHNPAVRWDVVGDLGDAQGGVGSARGLEAYRVDHLEEERVVARDVCVEVPVLGALDVLGELEVQLLGARGQAEAPVPGVEQDSAHMGLGDGGLDVFHVRLRVFLCWNSEACAAVPYYLLDQTLEGKPGFNEAR